MYLSLVLGSLLATLFYIYFIKPLKYWKNKGVVFPEPLYFIGNLGPNIFRRVTLSVMFENMYKQFPNHKYFGFFRFLSPILIIRDPELIKQITIKDFDYFLDHQSHSSDEIDPLWCKNLFANTGDKWRHMRPILSPSFTSSKMRTLFALVSACADQFMNHFLAKNGDVLTVEMKDTFTRYTSDVIGTCAFGIECNSLDEPQNDFYMYGKEATDFTGIKTLAFLIYGFSPFLAKFFDIKIIGSKTGAFFRNLTKTSIRLREERGIVRPDMIHLLMEARKQNLQLEDNDKIQDTGFATVEESDIGKANVTRNTEITDDDITAQALLFFLAGFDTAATLMTFIAYELMVNKDIQDKLREEVDETLRACDGKLTYEALHKMKYLDMVVSETLRKWPPTPLTDRVCVNEYRLDRDNMDEPPLIIEKGTSINIPIYAIQRDAQYYPEPEKFCPERFNDENKANINPSTFIPFGIGPRNCIGSRFALMENKTIIFHILTKFELVPVRESVIPVMLSKQHFNMTVEGGMWLGLKKRNL